MSRALDRLKDITQALPAFPRSCEPDTGPCSCKEYEMDSGTCLAWSLLSQPAVSVARWFNSKGTNFQRHVHAQREWIIVYKGMLSLHINEKTYHIGVGESFEIDPETEHSATFDVDTWYLAITIPESPDWPSNKVGVVK